MFGVLVQKAALCEDPHWQDNRPQSPTIRYLVYLYTVKERIHEQHHLVFDGVQLEYDTSLSGGFMSIVT